MDLEKLLGKREIKMFFDSVCSAAHADVGSLGLP